MLQILSVMDSKTINIVSSVFDAVLFVVFAILFFIFCKIQKILKVFFIILPLILISGILKYLASINKEINILIFSSTVFELITIFVMIVLVFVYQNDFKSFFNKIQKIINKKKMLKIQTSDEELTNATNKIVKACQNFSKNNIGALIVIIKDNISDKILQSGTKIDSEISIEILESIFLTKGPLHDGAVIIKENKILAAGCFLPLSTSNLISQELGTRHRAAIGITEESNVTSIVVSEENSSISTAKNGKLKKYITPDALEEIVFDALKGDENNDIGEHI